MQRNRYRFLGGRLGSSAVAAALALLVLACGQETTTSNPPGVSAPPAQLGIVDPANGAGACMGDDAKNLPFNDPGGLVSGFKDNTDPNSFVCTAKEVYLATATVTSVFDPTANGGIGGFVAFDPADPPHCVEGGSITFQMTALVAQNANSERQDIGVWIATDAGNAKTGACNHYNLPAGTAGTTNLDGDQCAGLDTGGSASINLGTLTVPCTPGADSKLSVGSCIGWKVPGETGVCSDDSDGNGTSGQSTDFRAGTLPTNKAKCNCEPFLVPIVVDKKATIAVNKVCSPTTDNGTFDLEIDNSGDDNYYKKDDAACGTGTGVRDVGAGTSITPGADHSVSESDFTAANYTSTLACTKNGQPYIASEAYTAGTDRTVHVEPNDAVVCTFTNVRKGSIKIIKNAIPDDGQDFSYTASGTGMTPSSFSLDDDADGTLPNFQLFSGLVPGGTRTVTEGAVTGWTLTNIACTGATNSTISRKGSGGGGDTDAFQPGDDHVDIGLAAGENVECTFTNTGNASLAIQKQTVGGTASFSYTVDGTGLSAFSRNTATQGNPTTQAAIALSGTQLSDSKYVTESALAGWVITNIACTANGATYAIGTGQGAGFSEGATAGYDQGDNTVKVDLTAGDSPTCTFTNTKSSSLAIQKATTGGTASFDYTVDGTGLSPFSRNTATQGNPTTQAAFEFTGLQLGLKYVTETALTGWTLTNIVCTANGATYTIGTGQGAAFDQGATAGYDQGDNTVKVDVTAGTTPTCTFTNTKNASLAIQKSTAGGTASFDFTGTGAGVTGSFSRNTATQGNPTTEAAFPITGIQLGDKYAQETALTGWTLTNIVCTANGATYVIGRGGSGAFVNGGTDGFDAGDNTVKVTVGAGNTPTCTFTNTKQGSIKIVKDTKNPETDAEDFTFTASGTGMTPTTFDLDDDADATLSNEQLFSGLLPNGTRTVTEGAETNWVLTNIVCTGATSSTISRKGSGGAGDTDAFQPGDTHVDIGLAAGEDIVCTFTNERKARLIVEKEVVGGGTQSFDFSRSVAVLAFSLMDGENNNSGYTLLPNTYRVCELNLAVAWDASATLTPPGGAATLINPDSPADVGNRCVDVTLAYGDSKTLHWVNTPPPGGDARTIGYWKNWSSCAQSNGKQYDKAVAAGNFSKTLDGNLPQLIGDLNITTCPVAVSILDKSDVVDGTKRANDAAYGLAAQLLAAKMNVSAGAGTCAAATTAIAGGQALLDAINFLGTGTYLKANSTNRTNALAFATTLDKYNNNTLCP